MSGRVFVDTNVLAYAFGSDADPRQGRASEALRSLRTSSQLVVSSQVLGELFVVLTRKLSPPLSEEAATAAIAIVARWEVIAVDGPLVLSAIERHRTARISYWDALIVEAARRGGCDRLLTEDLHTGMSFDGVLVEDPFADVGRTLHP
jgi:predicted nucleic acid-binding protein